MKSTICTLFEGHYHFGVATLANSLYHSGFRGAIYVGYRGELPNWANGAEKQSDAYWKDVKILTVAEDLKLTFIHLDTNYSLTNYKPDFMEALWGGLASETEAMYYFDPDIVVTQPWSCFEQWVTCGVAVCEDINSPVPEWHPRRVGWRTYYQKYQLKLAFKSDMYANGGFIGLTKEHRTFLNLWIKTQTYMGDAIGGLENSIFSSNPKIPKMLGFQIFDKTDQDALNASIEAFHGPVSFIGAEVMGFRPGSSLMQHALGVPKPWKTNLILRALNGKPPRYTDVEYWNISHSPILVHNKFEITRKRASIYIGKFIGRFYKT